MKEADVVEALRRKLAVPSGRHLYGVLASYKALDAFGETLRQAKMPDGKRFPKSLSVNRGILDTIPDDEFRTLVEHEAKRPEPTAAHVAKAFETFLRVQLRAKGLVILAHLELLFAYHLELNLLRTLSADEDRILLLLPGKHAGGKIVLFPDFPDGSYTLPTNLIAENHLWELRS